MKRLHEHRRDLAKGGEETEACHQLAIENMLNDLAEKAEQQDRKILFIIKGCIGGKFYNSFEEQFLKPKGSEGVEIIVNTKAKKWKRSDIDYEEIIDLANVQQDFTYTVAWHRKIGGLSGTLTKGEILNVTNGMIINVALTNNA